MPYIIKTLIMFLFFIFTAKNNFPRLWKAGLIGLGIMLVSDTVGHFLNLYHYKNGLIMIGGYIPFLLFFSMFIASMLYLNWLPRQWSYRLFYTIYVSVLFLAIEAMIYQGGGIVYPNWKLWYSYFLNISGLSLLAFLSDFVTPKENLT